MAFSDFFTFWLLPLKKFTTLGAKLESRGQSQSEMEQTHLPVPGEGDIFTVKLWQLSKVL